jgi:hypothetical protein
VVSDVVERFLRKVDSKSLHDYTFLFFSKSGFLGFCRTN